MPHGSFTPAQLRAHCLEFNGAEETFPFGPETSVFKVGGKMFAISALEAEPLTVSLKCDPDLAVRLREEHPAITGGYHLNKRHWNTVLLDGSVPELLIREMIEDSYDLIVAALPRKQQVLLDWAGLRAAGRVEESHRVAGDA